MNTKLITLLICISIAAMGFISPTHKNDEYTYKLTVVSLNNQTQNFDLTIKKHNAKEIVLKDLKTPYEKELGVGTYDIIVDKGVADASIEANVAGILNKKKWTWAVYSNKDHKMIKLQAGPEGQTGVLTDW